MFPCTLLQEAYSGGVYTGEDESKRFVMDSGACLCVSDRPGAMGSDLSRFTSAHTSMRKAPRKASTRSARLGALQASSKANQSPTADPAVRSRDSAERPGGDENDENQGNKENEEIGVKKKGDARVRCPPLGEQQCRKRSAGNLEVLDGRKDLSALESAQGTPGTRWPIEGGEGVDVWGCWRVGMCLGFGGSRGCCL